MELEDLDDVDLTEEEKAMVVDNDKAGMVTEIACHFCGMQFNTKKMRSLRAHIEEVHVVGDTGYMCGVCCEEFESRKAVEAHMSTLHRAPKPFGCGICGETFRVRNLLIKHIDGHSKQDLDNKKAGFCYCGECFQFFESVMSLQTHVMNHREVPVFVCAACGLQTQHRHVMVKHLETHVISNLLTASENKENGVENVNNCFPSHVQIDASKIDTVSASGNDSVISNSTPEESDNRQMNINVDAAGLDIMNSFTRGGEDGEREAESVDISTVDDVLPEENANYKCGLCDALFTNLADALTHAGSHQDEEGTMQQVEINVLMEEKSGADSLVDESIVDQVKTELLNADSDSMDIA